MTAAKTASDHRRPEVVPRDRISLDPKGVIVILAFGVVLVSAFVTMREEVDTALSDSTADWLVVQAAQRALSPWSDLTLLAENFGVDFAEIGGSELGEIERIHPRTPAALLIMSPLGLTSPQGAYTSLTVLTSASLMVSVLWLIPAIVATRRRYVVLAGTVTIAGGAYLATLEFGSHSGVLLLLVCCCWVGARRGAPVPAGVALGIAGALRIFPFLLLIPLWRAGERKAVYWALSTFVVTNLLSILVFDLNLMASLRGLTDAGGTWIAYSGNGSLAMPLVRAGIPEAVVSSGVVVIGTGAAWLVSRPSRNLDLAFGSVLLIALLASPLSWEHYDLVILPAVGFLASTIRSPRLSDPILWGCAIWGILQLAAIPLDAVLSSPTFSSAGVVTLGGRVALAVAAGTAIYRHAPVIPAPANAS